jgi:vitamin B12 transporter
LVFNSRLSANDRLTQDLSNGSYQDQYSYKGRNIFTELYNQYKVSENISFVGGIQYEVQNLGSKNLPWGGTSMEDVQGLTTPESLLLMLTLMLICNYQIFIWI